MGPIRPIRPKHKKAYRLACRPLWAGFAELARVEPRAYLGEAARRAIRAPEAVTLAGDLKSPEA